MRLHDTATGTVRPIRPRDGRVGMYVCGITPYDGGHVGHAFTYHTFDVIGRRLRGQGVEVRSVRNVTDVDDDILRVARERGVDYRVLGDAQVARFNHDMADLDLVPVDAEPRATGHVEEMVSWIERLVAVGVAYDRDGWVYFDVSAFPRYGALSRLDDDQMIRLSRERGGNPQDPRKRHPLDFVLWQPSLPEEPRWPSPWGDGRPGWHIECTVLSTAELPTPIDIHGGGDDLIFPHHEAEVAQSEAAGVVPFVDHWVHVAMVRYRGEKMSKSLGNLVFVRDLLAAAPASTIRLLLAARHYRESWEFDENMVTAAAARAERYRTASETAMTLPAAAAASLRAGYLERIDDDLDTPGALEVLDSAVQTVLAGQPHGGSDVPAGPLIAELLEVVGARLRDR